MCMLFVQLPSMSFIIQYDNWKALLFIRFLKVFCNRNVVVFFEANVLKEVYIS